MVAYLPQKREEGLRNNTLKQLFREEIKKSYEEFVDQIGKEFAESTTHFQDALNDVLAGARRFSRPATDADPCHNPSHPAFAPAYLSSARSSRSPMTGERLYLYLRVQWPSLNAHDRSSRTPTG